LLIVGNQEAGYFMPYKITEFQGVAAFLSVTCFGLLRNTKISKGWRSFLARIPINSTTDPIEKNKAEKTLPLFHCKNLGNYRYLILKAY